MKFEGMNQAYDPQNQEEYEQDILTRYVDNSEVTMDESKQKMQQWTKEDYLETQAQVEGINLELKGVIEAGLTPNSPQAQQVIAHHFESIKRFYTPSAEVYSSLGDLYVEQADFKKLYDAYHPQLAEFLRDGMKKYAERNLK
ncbi:hypothetical protein J2T13_002976 [Paenibacillus sp. DS2015]|uniref:TipAS antibiotic-recognition domain-containing protein n=1 Tax=Paenibacillus sp. DS2015 TaxID=3373917 RepID=UPI003D248DC8